jgi:uncharacterized protein YgiM (DUF1202 family)
MHYPEEIRKAGLVIVLSLLIHSAAPAHAQGQAGEPAASWRARFLKAYVIDDRLSALRREPSLQSRVMRRLRAGRRVFILETKSGPHHQPKFYRVAVTRRTRGWVHWAALAVPGRAGEDERVMGLVESAGGIERVALCRLFVELFGRSALVPRALLAMAEEAERSAEALTARAHRRLKGVEAKTGGASLRDYYLSDPGLDRYSRLGVGFDFDAASGRYV